MTELNIRLTHMTGNDQKKLLIEECCRGFLRIRSVARDVILAAMVVSLAACGSTRSQHVYKLYPGPELPDSDVATMIFGDGVFAVEIDGLKVSSSDYGTIKLSPGEHSIRWGATFLVSVMVNSSGFDHAETENVTDLVAGHTYIIQSDRTTGHSYRMYLWIEDAETGEAVAGTRLE